MIGNGVFMTKRTALTIFGEIWYIYNSKEEGRAKLDEANF